MLRRPQVGVTILAATLGMTSLSCHGTPVPKTSNGVPLLSGVLIPASTTMVTAWDMPQNPLTDKSLDDSRLSKDIRWGFKLFNSRPWESKQFGAGKVTA